MVNREEMDPLDENLHRDLQRLQENMGRFTCYIQHCKWWISVVDQNDSEGARNSSIWLSCRQSVSLQQRRLASLSILNGLKHVAPPRQVERV
jgi:hypothetical protein